jgi:hypothetical protein
MNLARTTRETIHGNPGERRVLPANTLVALVPASNLPPDSPIKYWAYPVHGHPWPEETEAWARDAGVGLAEEDAIIACVDDKQQEAVRRFIECWNLSMPYHDIGRALNCGECNALRDLLLAFGEANAAKALMEAHALGDDEGDDPEHFRIRTSLTTEPAADALTEMAAAAKHLQENWEHNLTESMARLNQAVAMAQDVSSRREPGVSRKH